MKPHYPWPHYRNTWSSAVELSTAKSDPSDGYIEVEKRRVRLDLLEDWLEVSVQVEIRTTEGTPDPSSTETAFLLLSVPQTNARIAAQLTSQATETERTFVGSLKLRRSDLAGVGTISMHVADQATSRVIADAEPWTVIGDLGVAPPNQGAPPFASQWLPFKDSNLPAIVARAVKIDPHALFVFDAESPDKPILYLNDSIDGLKKIIEAPSPHNERRRQQQVLAGSIARDASRALFVAALGRVAIEDGEIVDLPGGIHSQMLVAVASEINGLDRVDDTLLALRDQNLSDSERAHGWSDVEAAISRLVDHAGSLKRVLEEMS